MLPKKFVRDAAGLEEFRRGVKLCRCPACGRVGWLNSHGFARGYAEDGAPGVLRGGRFFCSNRRRRRGCGGTFSVLLESVLRRFVVRSATLWCFVAAVLDGASRREAWRRVSAGAHSERSGYRLWARLFESQPRIRSKLCRRGPPPECSSSLPLAQMRAHLRVVLPDVRDAFAAFQSEFQTDVFRAARPR